MSLNANNLSLHANMVPWSVSFWCPWIWFIVSNVKILFSCIFITRIPLLFYIFSFSPSDNCWCPDSLALHKYEGRCRTWFSFKFALKASFLPLAKPVPLCRDVKLLARRYRITVSVSYYFFLNWTMLTFLLRLPHLHVQIPRLKRKLSLCSIAFTPISPFLIHPHVTPPPPALPLLKSLVG
jgi:hypothetical protein